MTTKGLCIAGSCVAATRGFGDKIVRGCGNGINGGLNKYEVITRMVRDWKD